MRIPYPLSIVVALMTAGTACGGGPDSLDESISVEAGGTLTIVLDRGHVEVVSHLGNEVRIEAVARGWDADDYAFALEHDDRDVELRGELDPWSFPIIRVFTQIDVKVRAFVPPEYSVDVRTARGDVRISRVNGSIGVKTSRGHVTVERVEGDVVIANSRGDVEAKDVSGDLEVKTSRGAIRATGVRGDVVAVTNRAPIELRMVGGDVEARTSRGGIRIVEAGGRVEAFTNREPIEVSFVGDPSGNLETNRSEIDVELPKHAGVDLDAATSRAEIEVDGLEVEGQRASDHVVGKLNGGGERLRLRTNRAAIRVAAR